MKTFDHYWAIQGNSNRRISTYTIKKEEKSQYFLTGLMYASNRILLYNSTSSAGALRRNAPADDVLLYKQ